MGLLDLFNKWITEHGSAAAHEKHIALFRDQLLAADKKIASLNEELVSCRGENKALRSENVTLKEEIANLNVSIQDLKRDTEVLEKPLQKHPLMK